MLNHYISVLSMNVRQWWYCHDFLHWGVCPIKTGHA